MDPLDTIGVSLKAKYVKRTGSPGKYRYWYRNPKTGALQVGKQKPKTYSKKEGIPTEQISKKLLSKFEKEVKIKKDALQEEFDSIHEELEGKIIDANEELGLLEEKRADLYRKFKDKQGDAGVRLSDNERDKLVDDYNFEDGQLKDEEAHFNEEVDRLDHERDNLNYTFHKKMDQIKDIEKGGKKIHGNTGELGGAMEKLEELGASGEILYG